MLKRKRTAVAWMLGMLLLATFIAVAAHHVEGRRFAELLRRAQPAWLGAAAALQVVTYLCAAAVWQRALRRNGGVRRSVQSLVPLGLPRAASPSGFPWRRGLQLREREMMDGTGSVGPMGGAETP
jgi:uncharacterized membrane protein YbhN (UPF0104 family)